MSYLISTRCIIFSPLFFPKLLQFRPNFTKLWDYKQVISLKLAFGDKYKYLLFWKFPFLGILSLPIPNTSFRVNHIQDWQRCQITTHYHRLRRVSQVGGIWFSLSHILRRPRGSSVLIDAMYQYIDIVYIEKDNFAICNVYTLISGLLPIWITWKTGQNPCGDLELLTCV